MVAARAGGVREYVAGLRTKRLNNVQTLTLGVALIVVVLLNGCAGLVTNPPNNTQPGSLQLNPSSVSFGRVGLGKQSTQSISLTNPSKGMVTITQVSVSNPQFTLTGLTLPLSLPSGQTANGTVTVKPTTMGNVNATLSVSVDSSTTPMVLNLSATGVNPQPQLSPSSSSVDLGSVTINQQGTANVTLTNAGGADLTISMLTVSGGEFAISGIATPKTIGAGQSTAMTISFHPTTSGSATGTVIITSNDPTNPTVNISLTGSGTNTPAGQLVSNPTSVSFGNVNAGASSSKQIVLTNTGNAAVKISKVTVAGTGFSASGVTAPATLNASQSVTLNVGFAPASAASASGSVTVTSDAKGSPLTVALSGTGIQAGLSVSPTTFNFGSVVDGQTKSQTFSVTNTGSATLTIAQLSVAGAGYTVNGLSTPAMIAAGQSATFSALFAPTTAGNLSGTVSISSNAPNSPSKVTLGGTGVAASVTLSASPSSLAFGSVNAGSSSSKSVTLTNSGNSNLTISQITVNAKDVQMSGITTPLTLTPGQGKAMNVAFSPVAAENVTGNLTVTSSQGASSVIAVNGTGVQAGLSLTPSSVSFGSVTVGSANSQTVKISNSGTGSLTISQVSVSGSGFSSSGLSLPLSLNAGASSTFNVQFLPTSAGSVTGNLSIVSNAPSSPANVSLSGTGTAATKTLSFSKTSINFGNVAIGGSVSQNVVITNTGNSDVLVSSIATGGSGFGVGGAGTPVTLTGSQSLTISVSFSPSASGSASGSVTVTSNASGSPATISLSGSGIQASTHTVALAWNASTSTVSGYNVYRSSTSGSGYVRLNGSLVTSLSYTDSTLLSGTTYYYVTTAVDATGNESTDSNEAQAIIP